VVISPDSRTVAGWRKRAVQLWDLASGRCTVTLETDRVIGKLGFSSDSRKLAIWGRTEGFSLWDVQSGRELWQRPLSGDDSRRNYPYPLVDYRTTGHVNILDEETGQPRARLLLGAGDKVVHRPTVTADGRCVAVLSSLPDRQPGTLEKWLGSWWPFHKSGQSDVVIVADLATGRERLRLRPAQIHDVYLSEDGQTLLTFTGGPDGVIECWDIPARPRFLWTVGVPLTVAVVVLLLRWWRARQKTKPAAV
jgi:WD40 repeat protein